MFFYCSMVLNAISVVMGGNRGGEQEAAGGDDQGESGAAGDSLPDGRRVLEGL